MIVNGHMSARDKRRWKCTQERAIVVQNKNKDEKPTLSMKIKLKKLSVEKLKEKNIVWVPKGSVQADAQVK